MCLILLSFKMHPDYSLVVAANRDEYFNRPTRPLSYWGDAPHVLAGRDVKHGGTWLGVSRNKRFAALTNYRDPAARMEQLPSRGLIVKNFLSGTQSPPDYLTSLKKTARQYNFFNLLLGDIVSLYYYSNRTDRIQKLEPGIYGLSNHLLDTPWPKVIKGKQKLQALIVQNEPLGKDALFEILMDSDFPPPGDLPNTGVGPKWERKLSPIFISGRIYGTRSAAVVTVKNTERLTLSERTFYPNSIASRPYHSRTFRMTLSG